MRLKFYWTSLKFKNPPKFLSESGQVLFIVVFRLGPFTDN